MSSRLLASRRFLPLFVTQFLGAFNDNLYKNALVVLLTFQAAQWTTLSVGVLANLAAGLFILPFFLFSATAGQLADKYDKARLTRLVKLLEIGIMLVAGAGFYFHSLAWLLGALFMLGLQSTLFGPIKYALLPQHLKSDELVGGNALIEAGTFVAILLGTLGGGLLAGLDAPQAITLAGLLIAIFGYLASRSIPAAPAPMPNLTVRLNPLVETWHSINFARESRSVFLAILGISWFWLFGALFLAQFPAYAKDVLGGSESTVTLLLAIFTVGVGVGSLACERLSGHGIELGLVPLGSIGLTLFALDLSLATPTGLVEHAPLALAALLAKASTWRILIDLLLIGLFGGFFIVPLYALIQIRSREDCRARVIAANNIINALFMVVGAIIAALLIMNGWSIPALFGAAAILNAAVAIYIYGLVPEFLVRFVVWMLLQALGRKAGVGFERIPGQGPALITVQHDRPLRRRDVLMVMAACPRPIRFVLDPELQGNPIFRWLMRETGSRFAAAGSETARQTILDALNAGQIALARVDAAEPMATTQVGDVPIFGLAFDDAKPFSGRRLFPTGVPSLVPHQQASGD